MCLSHPVLTGQHTVIWHNTPIRLDQRTIMWHNTLIRLDQRRVSAVAWETSLLRKRWSAKTWTQGETGCMDFIQSAVVITRWLESKTSNLVVSEAVVVNLFFFFLSSGVATSDFPSPFGPIFCILLRHFNQSHVLSHCIHKPPFWPSPFPLSWQLHPQHRSHNMPIILPLYMSKPPQSRVFSLNRPTCAVPVMYSFLILSILFTPNDNRNNFNSATSISAFCLFVSATVSISYNIAVNVFQYVPPWGTTHQWTCYITNAAGVSRMGISLPKTLLE